MKYTDDILNFNQTVYICHAYRGNIKENYSKVQLLTKSLKNIYENCVFMAVQVYLPHIFDDEHLEQDKIEKYYLKILSLCDIMLVFGGKITEGMQIELDFVNNNKNVKGKKIKTIFVDDKMYKKLNISKEFIEGG